MTSKKIKKVDVDRTAQIRTLEIYRDRIKALAPLRRPKMNFFEMTNMVIEKGLSSFK